MSKVKKYTKTLILGAMAPCVSASSSDSGAPRFNQQVIRVGSAPYPIALADLNHDSKLDIIVGNTCDGTVSVLLGNGRGHFESAPGVTDSWGHNQILLIPSDGNGDLILPGKVFPADLHTDSGVAAADFNKDGNLDIVTVDQDANVIGLLLGNGKGGFHKAPGSPFPAGDTPWSFTVGDVNGNENPDVAIIPYEPQMRGATRPHGSAGGWKRPNGSNAWLAVLSQRLHGTKPIGDRRH